MEAPDSSRQANRAQTAIVASATERSYGTRDVETGSVQDEPSSLVDVTRLLRIAVIALTLASLVMHFIGGEYSRILNLLALITALAFLWNLCFVLLAIYSPQTWKRRSNDDEPQKPYRRLAPLNDAWLSGYIFMFTLWAKLKLSNEDGTPNKYNIDAVFILNCATFVLSYIIAVFEQFEISWSRSLGKLVRRDSYHGHVQLP